MAVVFRASAKLIAGSIEETILPATQGIKIHPQQQDFLLCLLAPCADSQDIMLVSINIVRAINDG